MPRVKNSAFIIGCRASGKTSFLTGLCMLSRPSKASPFSMVVGDNNERTARFITDLKKIAAHGDWPPPTSDMVPLDFEVIFKKRSFLLSLLDYPGEDLFDAMETMDYKNKELIRQHIREAEIILVLLDPTQDMLSADNTNPEMTCRRQDALAMAVGKLASIRTEAGMPLPILGLLITKADLFDERQIEQLRTNNSALFSKLEQCARSSNLPCFPLSASGIISRAEDEKEKPCQYPEKPDPEGYEKLFDWLGLQVDVRRHQRLITLSKTFVLALVLIFFGIAIFQNVSDRNLATRLRFEPPGIIKTLLEKPKISKRVSKSLDSRGAAEFKQLNIKFEEVKYLDQVSELADAVKAWSQVPHLANHSKYVELLSKVRLKEDDIRFQAIREAEHSGNDESILDLITKYQTRFPTGGRHSTEVQKIKNDVLGATESRIRSEIRSIPITSRDSLSRISEKIADYLKRFKFANGQEEIRLAHDLATRLASANSIRIVLRSCGYEWEKERHHEIRWFVRNNLVSKATHRSSGSLRRSTTRNHQLEVRSTDWSNVRAGFYIRSNFWIYKKASERRISLLESLHLFNGNDEISFDKHSKSWKFVRPWMKAEVHIPTSSDTGYKKISPDQLQAYGDYIYPGDEW